MSKILNFQKKKTKKTESLQKAEGQKFVLILSMLSLVLVAIFANEQMTGSQREIYLLSDNVSQIEKLNRAIASAQPVTTFRDLDWEKKLTSKLNDELSRLPASGQLRVQLVDQLRFGELKGKYRLVQNDSTGKGLISEIEYVENSEVGDRPILLKNRQAFLEQYKDAFVISFAKLELDKNPDSSQEVYRLLAWNKQAVGKATVNYDAEGRLLSVRISSTEK